MTISQSIFISQFADLIIPYYKTERVLPSLTIAQAILESGWGTSELARKANNFFGLNNYNDSVTKGYGIYPARVPQEVNGKWEYKTENMCLFTSPAQSVECMMKWYNRDKPSYKALHGCTDYKEACRLIKEAGYATDSRYTDSLIRIIEEYNLTSFDNAVIGAPEEIYHYVQVGAFKNRTYAKRRQEALIKAGFPAIAKQYGEYVRIQCGAFKVQDNAFKYASEIRDKTKFDTHVTTESGTDIVL